jgi:lysophospholipase L1-like esterase
MKLWVMTGAVVFALMNSIARAQLQDGDFIAFCGDTITEQRVYTVYIQDYLLMCQPRQDLKVMNHGWGGQSTWDFVPRMRDDVSRYHPTVATVFFGMNDGGFAPLTPDRRKRYRESTQQIIDNFKRDNVRFIVLSSPSAVDTVLFKRTSPDIYNKTLAELRDIARELASQNGVQFVDVFTPMLDVMAKAKTKYGPDYDVAGRDGINPQNNGHLVIAAAFLKAMGCNGDIGTITVDLAAGKAEATPGHTVQAFDKGAVTVVSTRYPFCFQGEPQKQGATRGIIEFFPFNEELNRFRLIVHGAETSDRLKVTWGEETREYGADELAKGINLAGEFLDKNPFYEFFNAVHEQVKRQQGYELPMMKQYVHFLPQFMSMVPQDAAQKVQDVADLMEREREFIAREAAMNVLPVRHTIKIEKVQPAGSQPESASPTTKPNPKP